MLMVFSIGLNAQNMKVKAPQFGKGIRYTNQDTTFTFKFNFRMSSLFIATHNQIQEATTSQFLIRRSRLKFGGHALTPKLKYKVELGLSNRDISTSSEDGNTSGGSRLILDAVLQWRFAKNWELWVGQTKLPGNRERVISSGSLQMVDRSLVNSRFNIDRDAGIQLRGYLKVGDNAYINPSVAITQGEGRNITSLNYGGYDYTAHVDFLPLGKFSKKGDYFGADLARESKPKLAFGLTYDYNDGASRQGGQLKSFVRDTLGNRATNSLTSFMADMMFKYRGFSLMSEYAIKTAEDERRDLVKNFNTGTGFNVQAGYLFKNNVELSARYTTIRRDELSGLKDENEVTLGLSKYVVGHKLKVQADVSRNTAPGESEGVLRFRTQVEMQF